MVRLEQIFSVEEGTVAPHFPYLHVLKCLPINPNSVLFGRWGINDQMKKRAAKFEAAGFRTILPDLYHGKVATAADEAKHLYDCTYLEILILRLLTR